jgi:SHS2 domain-containing protein
MVPYEFLEDVAMADMAFRAWGEDLEETFIAAAKAVMGAMIEEPDTIQPREQRHLQLTNDTLEMLLFDFLQELVYYKDAEQLLLGVHQLHIIPGPEQSTLRGTASGEKLDPARHQQRADVKAVTLHRFSLEQTDRGWQAMVILDI